MQSWFHLLLLFFSPCFFFILFDPKPMRKQHLDLWTSHLLFQWKRLQGQGRDSEGSNNTKKKDWRLQRRLPQAHRFDRPCLRGEIWPWFFLSETLRERLNVGIKYPTVSAPVEHQKVTEEWNGRRCFRLFLCPFTNLFCKFGSTTKLDSWWQVLNCSVKEVVRLWGLPSRFGFFLPVQWENLSEYK